MVPVSVVQVGGFAGPGVGSMTISTAANITKGNSVIVVAQSFSAARVTSVTGGGCSIWQRGISGIASVNVTGTLDVWYGVGSVGGTNSVTVLFAGGSNNWAIPLEVSPISLEQAVKIENANAALATPAVTPGAVGDLLIGTMSTGQTTPGAQSPWHPLNPANDYQAHGYHVATSTAAAAYQESFEAGTTATWISLVRCTVANTTAQAHSGTHCLQITGNATGAQTAIYNAPIDLTATPDTGYSVSAWGMAAATSRACTFTFLWLDSGYNQIGTSALHVTDVTTGWTQIIGSVSPVANTRYMQMQYGPDTGVSSEVHYLDDITIGSQQMLVGTGATVIPNSSATVVFKVAGGVKFYTAQDLGGGIKVINLPDPLNSQDVATKAYVDNHPPTQYSKQILWETAYTMVCQVNNYTGGYTALSTGPNTQTITKQRANTGIRVKLSCTFYASPAGNVVYGVAVNGSSIVNLGRMFVNVVNTHLFLAWSKWTLLPGTYSQLNATGSMNVVFYISTDAGVTWHTDQNDYATWFISEVMP